MKEEDVPMSDEEFARMIREAPPVESDGSPGATYESCGNYAARLVLEFLEAHPEHRDKPVMQRGEFADPKTFTGYHPVGPPDLYDVMKEAGVPLARLGLTGFQWGWAFNAGRHVLGLPPEPNPAILTIGG